MVEEADQFKWSSARARLGLEDNGGFLDLAAWEAEYTREQWREVLSSSLQEEAFGRRLREASRGGRPLGGDEFARDLELRAGRKLRPLPAGRPRKQTSEADAQLSLQIGV
jgi:putative transposase